MHFEERELKPYAEPVSTDELKEGSVYFSVTFLDDDMLIPTVEPLVFIGRNLEPGDSGQVYFQDFDSYRRGVCYATITEDSYSKLFAGSENELGHLFHYERALEVLMACSLRRSRTQGS